MASLLPPPPHLYRIEQEKKPLPIPVRERLSDPCPSSPNRLRPFSRAPAGCQSVFVVSDRPPPAGPVPPSLPSPLGSSVIMVFWLYPPRVHLSDPSPSLPHHHHHPRSRPSPGFHALSPLLVAAKRPLPAGPVPPSLLSPHSKAATNSFGCAHPARETGPRMLAMAGRPGPSRPRGSRLPRASIATS